MDIDELREELKKEQSTKEELQNKLYILTEGENRLLKKVSELERNNQSLLETINNLSVALRNKYK